MDDGKRHEIITRALLIMDHAQDDTARLKQKLESLSDDLIARMNTFIDDATKDGNGWRLSGFLEDLLSDDTRTMNEMLRFALPLLVDNGSLRTRMFVRALHCYPQLPKTDDYSQASPEVTSQCAALLRVAESFTMDPYYSICTKSGHEPFIRSTDNNREHVRIADEKIVHLVIDHHKSVEQILGLIVQRRTTDTVLLREIVGSKVPALSDGVI